MNAKHANHTKRIIHALDKLIQNHKSSLSAYEFLCSGVNENELKQYCTSAIELRRTLIEDLTSEISVVDESYELSDSTLFSPELKDKKKPSKAVIMETIKKLEKAVVRIYMEVMRSNTFSNMTESILRGHLETLRNRLKQVKEQNASSMLQAA